MRAPWLAVGCATLLLSGCVVAPFPSGPSKNPTWWSSTWSEPGLYAQLSSLEGSPPTDFAITRKATSDPHATVLPFADASLAALDGAQPSDVSEGNYSLWMSTSSSIMRCDCVALEFFLKEWDPWDTPQDPERPTREGFLSFAQRVVATDDTTLANLADAFMASCEFLSGSAQEFCGVVITQGISFAHVGAALDAAGAQPVPVLDGQFGTVQRIGGGFEVTYRTPVRVMQGERDGQTYRLEVVPYDQARFNHYGDFTERGVNATEVRDALSSFMASLGRQPPENVTFDFSRW